MILGLPLRNRVVRCAALVTGWAGAVILPNTIGIKFLEGTFQNMPYFKEIKVEPETLSIYNEVVEDIYKSRGKPVHTENIDVRLTSQIYPYAYFKGCPEIARTLILLPFGCRHKANDVFYYHINISGRELLKEVCVLTENEKKFMMAEALLKIEDKYVQFRLILGATLIVAAHGILNYIVNPLNKQLKVVIDADAIRAIGTEEFLSEKYRRPRILINRAATIYNVASAVIYASAIGLYFILRRRYCIESEEKVIKKVCALGPAYVSGGKECYYKKLESNILRRTRHGASNLFEEQGEVVQSWWKGNRFMSNTLPLKYKLALYSEEEQRCSYNIDS
ncbi:hypothetical protein MAR_007547 [Mya arenaria]|uniref:Uncharacterized protein n=1 Tax=Mya arenaria TaxID=6604 RepID=A0ABY7DEN0_MYAAR|nr:uncharacterized protein LOC128234809 [Mya arenaria]WAQ95076.1 hypothetical protein MAR_007547 [Mya arenaria]